MTKTSLFADIAIWRSLESSWAEPHCNKTPNFLGRNAIRELRPASCWEHFRCVDFEEIKRILPLGCRGRRSERRLRERRAEHGSCTAVLYYVRLRGSLPRARQQSIKCSKRCRNPHVNTFVLDEPSPAIPAIFIPLLQKEFARLSYTRCLRARLAQGARLPNHDLQAL